MYHDMGWSNGWWVVMWVAMALFWASLAIGLIWVAMTALPREGTHTAADRTPEDLLARRLAAGDIDEPTYRRLQTEISDRYRPRGAS